MEIKNNCANWSKAEYIKFQPRKRLSTCVEGGVERWWCNVVSKGAHSNALSLGLKLDDWWHNLNQVCFNIYTDHEYKWHRSIVMIWSILVGLLVDKRGFDKESNVNPSVLLMDFVLAGLRLILRWERVFCVVSQWKWNGVGRGSWVVGGFCSLELMNFWVVSVIIVIMPGKQG